MSQTPWQTFDWAEEVRKAEGGPFPPAVTYEFSNGRTFKDQKDMVLKIDVGNGHFLDIADSTRSSLLQIGVSI